MLILKSLTQGNRIIFKARQLLILPIKHTSKKEVNMDSTTLSLFYPDDLLLQIFLTPLSCIIENINVRAVNVKK